MKCSNCPLKKTVWSILRIQAEEIVQREPLLKDFIIETVLQHSCLRNALVHRLSYKLGGNLLQKDFFLKICNECLLINLTDEDTEHDFEKLAYLDLIAVEQRDPACRSIAQVLLYNKGYKSIQIYRLSHILWKGDRKDLSLILQARCTEVFGVDIHPGAVIGGGLMIDHGTGVVLGETCVIGTNVTIMHGVTLGGTGNSPYFDRHPKIGNGVFLGCQVTVLGNIRIGNNSKVGACSLVLKELPDNVTAVGSPAKVVTSSNKSKPFSSSSPSSNYIDSPGDGLGSSNNGTSGYGGGIKRASSSTTLEEEIEIENLTSTVDRWNGEQSNIVASAIYELWNAYVWRPKSWYLK